ncbi:MAG: arginine--tRNA ligase [Candidatus Omnitrophica bacterium]|nr:arginine--tRNA ligase [Candidatus Omnitrophota bacterium]
MKNFYDKVTKSLEDIIKADFNIELEHPLWELPQKQEFGDLSSMAALKLASKLKKDPLELAGLIKSSLNKVLSEDLEKIEILKPGFINIFLSRSILIESLNQVLKKKDDFFRENFGRKVLIEFLSANPTGPLSIAHGRQAIVGDTIANILEFCGDKVEREYYLNDAGGQIDLFSKSIASALKAITGRLEYDPPEGGYKGDYILDIAREFLAKKIKEQPGDYGMDSMVNLIKKDISDLGIKPFKHWFSQKKLIEQGQVEKTLEFLKAKDLVYESENALWFLATKFGDDKDRVVKKADQELTYFACDIAYHKNKYERGYQLLINLWGPDHHGYIKRVKNAVTALGFDPQILKIIIIQLVTLKSKEKMSKRAGTFVLLSDLIKDVGKDAVRFYYLMRKNSSHLEFDIDLAKESSFDNPLYYIQYVCARIQSIFKKAEDCSFDQDYSRFLSDEQELLLLRTLLQFTHCLEKAYFSLEPVFIIEFLKNLAAAFHKFYEKVRVIDQDKNLTQARLNLLKAVLIVFHCGLNLLGITPVERM